MNIAQKIGSDPVIEPDPVRSGVCTYPWKFYSARLELIPNATSPTRPCLFGFSILPRILVSWAQVPVSLSVQLTQDWWTSAQDTMRVEGERMWVCKWDAGSVVGVGTRVHDKNSVGGVQWEVCLFVLRFYSPVNPMGSCQARTVYLTTLLLGRHCPLSG